MVFKKPYAFLIKNFKIIHLILLAFICYVTYHFAKVYGFFSSLAKSGIKIYENMASDYISGFLFIAVLLIMVFAFLMLLLMIKKKKPVTFYILLFVYYSIILVLLGIAYSTINSLYEISLGQKSILGYRDVYLFLYLPSFYFLAIAFVRGIGFDVKKFNFNKDLEELEIKSEDNEEFEFVLGTENYKYERKFRRFLREIKYYILENKFIYSIIGASLIVILIVVLVLNSSIFNKKYHVGQSAMANAFSLKVNNAYISQNDYNGVLINKNKKYVIVDLTIKNNGSTRALAPSDIYLSYGSNNAYYKTTLGEYFSDLGLTYKGGVIAQGKSGRYILIYELSENANYSSYVLNVFNKKVYNSDGTYTFDYIKYKIKPTKLDNSINKEEKKLNEVMFLGNSLFKDSSLNIKSAKLYTSYEYKYKSCIENDCTDLLNVEKPEDSSSLYLLVIEYKLDLKDESAINNAAIASIKDKYIFDRFLKVQYTLNNKTFTKSVSSRINSSLKNIIFMDINKNVKNAENINLLINTRINHYNIKVNFK